MNATGPQNAVVAPAKRLAPSNTQILERFTFNPSPCAKSSPKSAAFKYRSETPIITKPTSTAATKIQTSPSVTRPKLPMPHATYTRNDSEEFPAIKTLTIESIKYPEVDLYPALYHEQESDAGG